MFYNFKEKKINSVLGIILTIVTIIVTVKTCFHPNEQDSKPNVSNSGDNSNLINGNGNTINNNSYIIPNKESKYKNLEKIKKQSVDFNQIPVETEKGKKNLGKIKIAILPFEYISNDKKYEWLSKGISESLLVDISKIDEFIVLEGTLRDKVIKEIDFQQSGYIDIKSAVEFGKMLGANKIIIGSYQIINEKIKITSRIVDVESGKVQKNSSVDFEDSTLDLFKMQKKFSSYFTDKINY